MSGRLSDTDLAAALEQLRPRGWSADADRRSISKSFQFKSFAGAFGWMAQAALAAEKLNHHPDWSNSYNRVDVSLTTHSAGGLTGLDIRLADMLDRI